jgi:superoxide dismutase, Fe-Mn family
MTSNTTPNPSGAADPGAALHALCLASQGSSGVAMVPAMQLALQANFGSVAQWQDSFAACAQSLGGAPGWVLLVFLPQAGSLANCCASNPTQALASGVVLLALAANTPLASTTHAPAALADPNWAGAYARYQDAVHHASEGCGMTLAEAVGLGAGLGAGLAENKASTDLLVLDVRRAGMYAPATTTLPGAQWHDPAAVASWARTLPPASEVLVYCIYGHEVGRATALRLRACGVKARYLEGGIDGWQAAGQPLQAKAAALP